MGKVLKKGKEKGKGKGNVKERGREGNVDRDGGKGWGQG